MQLNLLPETLAICKLRPEVGLDAWTGNESRFLAIVADAHGRSVVCDERYAADERRATQVADKSQWRGFQVEGVLDFDMVGILAELTRVLAAAGIPVFVVSSFETDYVLVKRHEVDAAVAALRDAGHAVNLAESS